MAQILTFFTTDAPFVPVPKEVEDVIIQNMNLNNQSILYDLGCGDARILIKAVEKYPDMRAVGVEIAFIPYYLAKFKTRKYKNLLIKRENIFETETGDATHVFVYLFPKVMEKLVPILKEKCKTGTRIISCDFEDKNHKTTEIIYLDKNDTRRGNRLIVYTL